MFQTLLAELCLWVIARSFSSFSRLSWVFVKRCKCYRLSALQESKIKKVKETETETNKTHFPTHFLFDTFNFSHVVVFSRKFCRIFVVKYSSRASKSIEHFTMLSDLKPFLFFFHSSAGRWKSVEKNRETGREVFYLLPCTLCLHLFYQVVVSHGSRKSFELAACVQLNVNENKRHERQAANSKLPWSCPKFKHHTLTRTQTQPYSSRIFFHHISIMNMFRRMGFDMLPTLLCARHCVCAAFLCLATRRVFGVCEKNWKNGRVSIQLQKKIPTEHKGGKENGKTEWRVERVKRNRCNSPSDARVM